MRNNPNSNNIEINEKIKELIIARIEAKMSPHLKLSIGSDGSLNKDEMIEHVKEGDNIGKRIIQVHLNFLRAQSSGELTKALNTL